MNITMVMWPDSQTCMECENHKNMMDNSDIVCVVGCYPNGSECKGKIVCQDEEV